MTIHKTDRGGTLVLALEGRLDATAAPQLQDELIPAFDSASAVELDFEKLVYVSSAGLRILLMGQKAANEKNATMTLHGVREEIMEIFEMTGFVDILTIV